MPVAEFEDLDSPTPGLDSLSQGIAVDANDRDLAVLLPAPIDCLGARRRERSRSISWYCTACPARSAIPVRCGGTTMRSVQIDKARSSAA